jgi:GMP synthase (glutamine-hydrolysing)
LIVLHQERSTTGRVGMALKAMGARLDIRRPSCGEQLPATLAEHDGVVVFGGSMGANDRLDWVRREIDWLETPLAEDKPTLGLCLGAQMLARVLGARVFSYDDKRSEIGYYPIEPTPAGEGLCAAGFPRTVYQWHSDGFDLPECAELLAVGGTNFPNQAYRYGRHAVGLQFHPEVTYHMDASRRRAPDPARRAEPPGASRRLVPARRPRGRLARGVLAGLAREAAGGARAEAAHSEQSFHRFRRRDRKTVRSKREAKT